MTGLLIGLAVGFALGAVSAARLAGWWEARRAGVEEIVPAEDVEPDTWAAEAERLYRRQHREERPPLGDLEEWMGGATRAIEP